MKKNTKRSQSRSRLRNYEIIKKAESGSFSKDLHNSTCTDCGKECKVPFKPIGNRPVYCKSCYFKHKPNNNNNK
ncbi:MAG: CxxC-x17-CxxC domain-containing protein [Candidatus Woesearchaeota archaeon]